MEIGRREFLTGIGGLGVGLGVGLMSHALPLEYPERGPEWSPGRERRIASTCLLCPAHCGIRGRLVDGRLVRIDGNPLHPVSRGGLCPKGAAGLQILHHPARLTGPLERTGPPGGSGFRRITWQEALDRVAGSLGTLRSSGRASSVAFLAGHAPGIMGELLRLFARLYGTPLVFREGYDDGAAEVLRLCQGIDAPPAFDLGSADLVLSFGAALAEASACLAQAAAARDPEEGRRPRFVQIDVRHSRSAARADEWVAVRPGCYGILALGIAYVLLKEGLYDAERVREQVRGMEDVEDAGGRVLPGFRRLVLRHGRVEEVAMRTGVPAETVVRVAKEFGAARRPLAIWDQNVSWRTGGLADALAIHALNLLAGAPGRPGGVLVQPALPVEPVEKPEPHRPARLQAPPGDWMSWALAGSVPPPAALLLYYSNPVASAPDGARAAGALDRIPLVVSFSPFLDESARRAHLVLPDHTYLERWQDAPAPASVPIPVWGLVQPVVEPLHDTMAAGDVLLSLARRMGGDVEDGLPWESVERIVRDRGRSLAGARRGSLLVEPFRRRELREMEARGWWIDHGMDADQFWDRLRETGGWFDPYYDYNDRSAVSQFEGGSVRIFPPEARDRIASTVAGLPEGFLPGAEDGPSPGAAAAGGYPLRLVPYRVMTLASGGTALFPWLLERLGVMTGDAWDTWAEVNPRTGRELGLSSGQRVRVESPAGSFAARLRFFEGAQPGVVNVPYGLHAGVGGWGSVAGSNPLRAAGDLRDPTTGLPDWHSARVRLVPA